MQDYLPRLCDESADRLPISGVPNLLLSGLDIVFKTIEFPLKARTRRLVNLHAHKRVTVVSANLTSL